MGKGSPKANDDSRRLLLPRPEGIEGFDSLLLGSSWALQCDGQCLSTCILEIFRLVNIYVSQVHVLSCPA